MSANLKTNGNVAPIFLTLQNTNQIFRKKSACAYTANQCYNGEFKRITGHVTFFFL